LVLSVLVLTARLAAQPGPGPDPDPLLECQSRASVLTNAAIAGVSVRLRGGLDNGNYIIWWDAKLASGRTVSGFCEASPLNGRTVRLGITQTDWGGANRKYRITPGDAERVCRTEARARFSPGNGLINAMFLQNISTKSIYKVEWWYGTNRKGRCEIDSSTGLIREFNASVVW
jgi:hypothetical protein